MSTGFCSVVFKRSENPEEIQAIPQQMVANRVLLVLFMQSLQDARFILMGTAVLLPEEEQAAAREAYLAKHPHAFYVDFGDFRWFRMEGLKPARFNGGFARAATVSRGVLCWVHKLG